MRVCPSCSVEQPLGRFSVSSGKRSSWCKGCKADASRRWRLANPDKNRETKQAWYQRNKDHVAAQAAAWREANPGMAAFYNRNYYLRHAERLRVASLEKSKRWCAENPMAYKMSKARSDAKRRGVPFTASGSQYIETVILADPCVYCGGDADTVDHIVPVAAGGDGDADNLAAACRSCNSKKGARSLLVFLADGGMRDA